MERNIKNSSLIETNGISLISLIITIIVIIILAAIVIFTGLNTPDRANFAKFVQEISDFQTAVTHDFFMKKQQYALESKTRTDAQIYFSIAKNVDWENGENDINQEPKGEFETTMIGHDIYPQAIEGKECYEITNDKNITNWKNNKGYFEVRNVGEQTGEHHYITDKGELFILPGYRVENDDTTRWYISANKYYESENPKEISQLLAGTYEISIPNATGSGDLSTGDGSEESPYLIQSIEDLCTLAKNVNERVTTYYEKTFKLEKNIDFQNKDSYIEPNGTSFGDINNNGVVEGLMTELTTGEGFPGIGIYNYGSGSFPFQGSIDGNHKTIMNLYKNNTKAYQGLINFLATSSAKICDLDLKNVNINCGYETAGLIGTYQGEIEIDNVSISGTIKSGVYTGGFLAYSPSSSGTGKVKITNSKNLANVICSSTTAGGFIGYNGNSGTEIIIENCSNQGNISSESRLCRWLNW